MAHTNVHSNQEIIWDPEKARRNTRKHRVRFADAALVLDDPNALTIRDDGSEPGEERRVTVGADAQGRVLVVVHTYRGEDVRIISARPADRRERD